MAMAHSYREGPAWREDYGLSPMTWVDSSESYGARYEPAPAARTAELSRRQSAPHMSYDSDLAHSQQAEVLGSTANYLMYEYDKKRNELYAAARRGDAERARMLVDEMRSWTDENRSSLVRWKDAGAPKDSVAGRLSAKAFELDSESYLDTALYPRESDYNTTVRELLDSRTPEAKQWALESAKKKLGLGSAAAAVYSDPDNPLYDALAPQRLAYQSATSAISRARGKKDVAQSLEDQRRAEAGLQVAAEFAGGHGGDDPERVRDFLKGAQRSSWFGNASRNRLDDLFQMYLDDYGSGRVRDSADWFGQLDESLSGMLPTQRRLVPQQDGSLKVVEEASQMTRPDRLPGMLVQARGILDETRFGATDYRTVSAALKKSVQKADVLARMAGVDDLQLVGRGDAAVADAVYGLTGDESLLQASYRGVPLKSNGRTLDDAYAGAVRLANVMGVNMDELTPVNGASADAPGLLGATAVDVYRAILRHRLDGSASEDVLVDKVEEVLARGSRDQVGYHELAREVVSRIARNEEAGLKMDFGQLLREIGGGLEVGTTRTQDGREVPVMRQVVPAGNRPATDYATLNAGLPTPSDDPGYASMRISDKAGNLATMQADRALGEWFTSPSYAKALEQDGRGGLLDAARAVASEIVDVHQRQRAGKHWESVGASAPAGKLLAQNLKDAGMGRLMPGKDDEKFVADDLLGFLAGHDKSAGRVGDAELNARAVKYLEGLSSRILQEGLSPDPAELNLWARITSECLNRGQYAKVVSGDTRKVLEKIGQVPEPGQVLEDVKRGDFGSLGWAATDFVNRAGTPGATGPVATSVLSSLSPLAPVAAVPTVLGAARTASAAQGVRGQSWLTRLLAYTLSPTAAVNDALGYVHDRAFTFSEKQTREAFVDLTESLGRVYGVDKVMQADPLKAAGLEIPIEYVGVADRNQDYAGILRKFDISQQARTPTDGQTSGSGVDNAAGSGPAVSTSAANAANSLLSSLASTDEELGFYMSELLGQAVPMFHEPKAAQYYVASLKPLLQDKLRREGSAATRAWVAKQGGLRRHVAVTGRLADGTPQYGQTFISPEDEQLIIERDFKNSRMAYDADQRYLAIQKDKFDSTLASASARAQVSSLAEE